MNEDKSTPKPKREYSSYIYLDFHHPTQAQFENDAILSSFVRKRLAKHPNARIIYVSYDDFEVSGNAVHLKSDTKTQEKYACLKRADYNTKITLAGHGEIEFPGIASNIGVYDSRGGNSYRKDKAAPFTAAHVTCILMLIKAPGVQISEPSPLLQNNLLKISVLACHGEYFSERLMQALVDRSFVCQITTTTKNHILYQDRDGKRYRAIEFEQREKKRLACAFSLGILCSVFGLALALVLFIKPSCSIETVLGLGLTALGLLILAAAIKVANDFDQGYDQNSKAKTVLFPVIENEKIVIKSANKALLASTSRFAFESSVIASPPISTDLQDVTRPLLG